MTSYQYTYVHNIHNKYNKINIYTYIYNIIYIYIYIAVGQDSKTQDSLKVVQ